MGSANVLARMGRGEASTKWENGLEGMDGWYSSTSSYSLSESSLVSSESDCESLRSIWAMPLSGVGLVAGLYGVGVLDEDEKTRFGVWGEMWSYAC